MQSNWCCWWERWLNGTWNLHEQLPSWLHLGFSISVHFTLLTSHLLKFLQRSSPSSFFFFKLLLVFSINHWTIKMVWNRGWEYRLWGASLMAQTVKNLPCNVGDPGSIPGSGRSHGEGNGYPLQYSCLENPMDRAAWRVTVYGVTKSQTQLGD